MRIVDVPVRMLSSLMLVFVAGCLSQPSVNVENVRKPSAFEQVKNEGINAREARKGIAEVEARVVDTYYRQGLVHYKNQRLKQAIQQWEKLLAIDPDHKKAKIYINKARRMRRKLKEIYSQPSEASGIITSYQEKEKKLSILIKNKSIDKLEDFVTTLNAPIYEPLVSKAKTKLREFQEEENLPEEQKRRIEELKTIVYGNGDTKKSHSKYSKNPFVSIQKLTQDMVANYLDLSSQVPPIVKKPVLPPPPKLVKDEFETKAEFGVRVNRALEDRQKEILRLQEKYREAVEARNAKIQELEQKLENRKSKLHEKVLEFTGKAFQSVMGEPVFKNPVYDAETESMYLDFVATNANYRKRVAIKVPRSDGIAKSFKDRLYKGNSLYNIEVKPTAIFKIEKDSIVLKEIKAVYIRVGWDETIDAARREKYEFIAELTDEDFKPEKIEVALQDKKVDFKAEGFELQNPNLIDTYQVSAIGYGESSKVKGKKYNDDLLPLIKKYKQRKVDSRKWLFIIAVENYDEADKVVFAKNSAEAFEKTAQKVFGIGERNTYALIDKKATSGKIKDKLSYLLGNVKDGDTIYFYYSGHGVPDPISNESFILPKDKVVDFIAREEQFKLSNIYKQLTDSKASKIVAFVDACFSGKTDNKIIFKGVAPGLMRTKKVGFDKNKMMVMTAGRATQFSNSFDEKGHRMFSYYLMKSLLTREHPDLDTVYKEVSVKVKDSSWAKGDIYLQEPQIDGMVDLGM